MYTQNKNFDSWNVKKKKLNNTKRRIYFKERQIWWCSIGLNVGFEQDGKNDNFERPVIVLKKFSNDLLWILPLTSQNKQGKYYYQMQYSSKTYVVILSQIRAISSKRLLRKMIRISSQDFSKIRLLVINFLKNKTNPR